MLPFRIALPVLLSGFALLGGAPAMAATCSILAGNLVTNCGFDTGDFSGWTQGGNTDDTFVEPTSDPGQTGNEADFGAVGSTGSISQVLTTQVGQLYTISFDLIQSVSGGGGDGPPGEGTSQIGGATLIWDAKWNTIAVAGATNGPDFGWTAFKFNVTGAGKDMLTFDFENDPAFYGLTNISVVPAGPTGVPEPASMALLGTALGLLGLGRVLSRRGSLVPARVSSLG